jgi:hypothetical protein
MSDAVARTFMCEDCSYTIHSYGYDYGRDICGLCLWLRNQGLSEEQKIEVIKLTRGDDDSCAPKKLN